MPKAICPECSKENDKRMFKNPDFKQTLLAKDKWIEELLEKVEELEKHCKTYAATLDHYQAKVEQLKEPRIDTCPHCQCSELLCGWPRECESDNA